VGDIVVGGKRWPVLGPVHLWSDTGLETAPGRGARKRKREIDLAVWHWTGGEGNARQLFDVLNARELGVEFFIDGGSEVWQFCDPALVDTFDAGWVNDRSAGIEIANYGYRRRGRPIPAKGRSRPKYTTILNGRRRTFAHFWPRQIAVALSLGDALSQALKIPRAVPRGMTGFVEPNYMEPERVREFKGHIGHFHCSKVKSDPGLDLLQAFLAAWTAEI
jgi:hypothetical protein